MLGVRSVVLKLQYKAGSSQSPGYCSHLSLRRTSLRRVAFSCKMAPGVRLAGSRCCSAVSGVCIASLISSLQSAR